jgi:hypothetical protein
VCACVRRDIARSGASSADGATRSRVEDLASRVEEEETISGAEGGVVLLS